MKLPRKLTISLSDDAIAILKGQNKKSSPYVFPSVSGRPISPDSVLHMLHRNGVDIKTVSGMLGHYSAGFTLDTYAHVTTAAQREAANTMGNLLAGAVRG